MTRRPTGARLSRSCRYAAAAGIALCAAMVGMRGALAQELNGRALLSYQSYDTGPQSTDGFHQQYDVNLLERLTDLIRLRLSFRAEDARNSVSLATGENSTSSHFTQLHPSGELLIAYPLLQLQALYELVHTTFGGEVDIPNRGLEWQLARLNWQPEFLPDVSIEAERRAASDASHALDMTDKRAQLTLSKTLGPTQFAATGRALSFEDAAGGTLRSTREAQITAAFDRSFAGDRLVTSASVNLLASRIEDSAGVGGGQVAQPVRIAAAATSIDETPLDSRDHPVTPAPVLINGMTSPPGIPLGPSGQSFLNVVLDLGRFAAVDEFRLIVREPSGDLVPIGGPVDWTVYVSTNQLDWRPVQGGSSTRFDAARSLYDVTFDQVETRYVKAVSFGTNAIDTDLVEVLAFEHIAVEPGVQRVSDQRQGTASASISGRPADWVTLSWNGLANISELSREGQNDQRTDDFDQLASALFQPVDWTELEILYQRRGVTTTGTFDQNFEQWTANLHFKPRLRLDAHIQALHANDETQGHRIRTDALTLSSSTQMWRSVDFIVDVGAQRQELLDENQTLTSRHLNGSTILQMTRGWTVTALAGVTQNDFSGVTDGTLIGPGDEKRWSLESDWRPSSLLYITARIGRVSAAGFSAGLGTVRLQLSPFAGGNLHFDSIYAMDVDTAGRRTSHRLLLSSIWTLNPHTSLNLTYTASSVNGPSSESIQSLFASFELAL